MINNMIRLHKIISLLIMATFTNIVVATPLKIETNCTKIISKENKQYNAITTFKTFSLALDKYVEGDIICIADSIQSVISIENFDSGNKPLTIRPLHYLGTMIKNKNYQGTGITVKNSNGIIINGFIIRGGLSAILIQDSSNISLLSNTVFDIGNQAISIKPRYYGGSHYLIKDNIIFNTGRLHPRYGEGLYIGDGSYTKDKSRLKILHTVSDVTIRNNIIHHTNNEAIDVKANAYNVKIINNRISNIDLKFNAAITIATESSFAELGGYLIESNIITDITNRSGYRPIGIAVGHGDTIIKDNLIIDDKNKLVAICLFTTFLNPKLNRVTLEQNRYIGKGTPFSEACTGGTKDNSKAVITIK